MRQNKSDSFFRRMSAALTVALLVVCGLGPRSGAESSGKQKPKPASAPSAAYAPEDVAAFSERFQKDIWPLLARKESHCLGCHTGMNPSQLRLSSSSDQNFKALLADGHFAPENPASLLSRIIAPDGPTRMPPKPFAPWTEAEIAVLSGFVNDLYAKRQKGAIREDEVFPQALLIPFTGKKAAPGADNTFLTYYQLRGKVKALFNDDWRRNDKDLWIENLAQFGGADFVRSFDESRKPTAAFLSGVDALSQDVVSRAYLASSGPFVGRAQNLSSPLKMTEPDAAYRQEIQKLYRRMLFREATPPEMRRAFAFVQGIYRAEKTLTAQNYDLRFELIARDENGLTTAQNFSIGVANSPLGLRQTLVNQNDTTGSEGNIVRRKLDGPYTFKANDAEQKVIISNVNTRGNVLVHKLEVRGPLPDGPTRIIPVTDPSVQAEGAWSLTTRDGIPCYEDGDQHKGASRLIIPVGVTQAGQYELTLSWRKNNPEGGNERGNRRRRFGDKGYAENVLVEVLSQDKSRLAVPAPATKPPKGEAQFAIDMSDDTKVYADLKTAFRFDAEGGVEVSNAGTRRRVAADAVKFVPIPTSGLKVAAAGAKTFLVLAKDAQGQDKWKNFQKSTFSFYKAVGPRVVSDENDNSLKGKLTLLYRPSSRAAEWKPEGYYRIEVGYPGEEANESHAPITVRAQASSPIVQVAYPVHAQVGAVVTLDATGSYNLQGTPLQFTWRQVGGPLAKLSNPRAPRLTFTAPAMTAQQAAWEGLCRALMKHPDFLFTRPLSLATAKDPAARRRLQLVKIAQDLVGRPPSATELAKLEKGASLASLVDAYLDSPEFADFYFRRIRLYLESHGTEEEDEPARLWRYIALHDRPFKELLTADYTVQVNGQRQPRPEHYGKSGILTMKGFIKGKPGLPHFNYAAQVCQKFLGFVFEVPPEIVTMREGITAISTTSPSSVCYSCHKILTPLAYQRLRWTDAGEYQPKDDKGQPIDDSDRRLVASYPFQGNGMEAFALQAQNKERFVRTILQTHFLFFFGREMRYDRDERGLYKRLWDTAKTSNYRLKSVMRGLLTSPEYLNGSATPPPTKPKRSRPSAPDLARR